jgi:hypothetical protein
MYYMQNMVVQLKLEWSVVNLTFKIYWNANQIAIWDSAATN